jgi:hypothetical protein
MAATHKGGEVAAKSPHSRRCGAELKDGRFCDKWAQRGKEHCFQHSVTEAEWLEAARRGGLAAAAKRRAAKQGSPRSGLLPLVNLEELMRVCTQGLSATFADAGLPNEADHTTRLLSVAALLQAFPRHFRATPDEAASLLRHVLPERLQEQDEDAEAERLRKQAEASYIEMRRAWDSERFAGELKGLYDDEGYPPWSVAPRDKAQLDAERRAGEPLVAL